MRRVRGSLVALPTPFRDDAIDAEAFARLVDLQLVAGTDGLVVAGTTGEAATLEPRERSRLVELARERAGGRALVVAGVGTNATRGSVELAREAARAGAGALLAVTPYYNRPSQRGLVAHYRAIADATDLPLVLYDVPRRTGVALELETVAALAEHANVVAIKDATGSLERLVALAGLGTIDVLVGEDALLRAGARAGAAGAIGVVSNLMPAEVRALLASSDEAHASALEARLAPLVHALFLESNPVPLKAALAMLGRAREEVRPPLVTLDLRHRSTLERTLAAAGLLAPAAAV